MTIDPTKPPRRLFDHVLWFAVGIFGLFPLGASFSSWPDWPALIFGLSLVSLSVIAGIRHWGSLVPCTIFGRSAHR